MEVSAPVEIQKLLLSGERITVVCVFVVVKVLDYLTSTGDLHNIYCFNIQIRVTSLPLKKYMFLITTGFLQIILE